MKLIAFDFAYSVQFCGCIEEDDEAGEYASSFPTRGVISMSGLEFSM